MVPFVADAIHEAAGKMAKAKQALGKPTKVKGIAVMKVCTYRTG